MPLQKIHFDPIELPMDSVAASITLNSPVGTKAYAAGGMPSRWDSDDGVNFLWVPTMAPLYVSLDASVERRVVITCGASTWGLPTNIVNVWISYWEED